MTILFLIVIFLFKNNPLLIFHILTLIVYILQYSGFNFFIFKTYLQFHAKLSFGRFVEVFPNAVTGFTFASLIMIEKLKKNRMKAIIFNASILIFVSNFNIFQNLKTYKYGGIRLNIAASCIFIIFSLLPIEKIRNKIIINSIKKATSYTGGIYYMHYLIGSSPIFKKILRPMEGTIISCILIYLISYFISHIGLKICGKSKFKYMFI